MLKKASRSKSPERSGLYRYRSVILITLVLCILGTSMLAQVSSRKKPKSPGEVSVMNLSASTPSKEYIYAGGRLVATEESAPGCDASNPASDTDHDGIPNGVETTEGTNPCVKDNDVFNNARLFAMQQYRDFLGREGDSGGITFWTNVLNAGSATRAQVINSFFSSSEFQGSTAPVTRLYFAYFLRIPDYQGLEYWVNQYRQGVTLDSISQAFAQSPEFIASYGSLSNEAFVTLLYQNVLGRLPDPGRVLVLAKPTQHRCIDKRTGNAWVL